MVTSRQLGEFIRSARTKAGMTQDDLSDKAGLAYSTLAKIEQGAIKSPSFFTINAIAEALEMSVDELTRVKIVKEPMRKPKKVKLKFIYSDMNGVLIRFYHKAFTSIAKETSSSFDLVETTFWHYNDAVNTGEITLEEFDKIMAKRLGVNSVSWKKHYLSTVAPINQMGQLLKEAHKKVKVGLLTNTMPGLVDALTEKGMLPKLRFDAMVDSSVVGYVKPNPKIYEIAERMCDYKGSEILFIDDSRTNIMAAEKMGWQVAWFDDYEPAESVRRLRHLIYYQLD